MNNKDYCFLIRTFAKCISEFERSLKHTGGVLTGLTLISTTEVSSKQSSVCFSNQMVLPNNIFMSVHFQAAELTHNFVQ